MWTFPLSHQSGEHNPPSSNWKSWIYKFHIDPQWSMGRDDESVQQIMAWNSYGYQVGITDLAPFWVLTFFGPLSLSGKDSGARGDWEAGSWWFARNTVYQVGWTWGNLGKNKTSGWPNIISLYDNAFAMYVIYLHIHIYIHIYIYTYIYIYTPEYMCRWQSRYRWISIEDTKTSIHITPMLF